MTRYGAVGGARAGRECGWVTSAAAGQAGGVCHSSSIGHACWGYHRVIDAAVASVETPSDLLGVVGAALVRVPGTAGVRRAAVGERERANPS